MFQIFASASYIYTYIPALTSGGGLGPKSNNRPTTWKIIARFSIFYKGAATITKGKGEGFSNCLKGDRKLEGNTLGTGWEHPQKNLTLSPILPRVVLCLLIECVKFLFLKVFVTIFYLCLYPFIRRWVPIGVAIQLLFHLPHFGSVVYIQICFQLAKPSICDYIYYSL